MKAMVENGKLVNFVSNKYDPGKHFEGEIINITSFNFTREPGDDVSRNKTRHLGAFIFVISVDGVVSRITDIDITVDPKYRKNLWKRYLQKVLEREAYFFGAQRDFGHLPPQQRMQVFGGFSIISTKIQDLLARLYANEIEP